jgi:hypothetical protein
MSDGDERSDRERDGYSGAVRYIRIQTADRARSSLGRTVETKRLLAETLTYDERGNRLDRSFYDGSGRLSRRYVYEYDDQDRRTRSVVTGPVGEVVEECAYTYDDDGALIADTITDARRKGVRYTHEHEAAGKRSVMTRARADNTPGRRETVTYDVHHRAVEMSVFATDGKLDHRWVYGYDRAGRRTSEISFFADGSFRSKELCKYNDRGDEYKLAVYRSDGSLSMKWAYTYVYDKSGNWIKRTVWIKSQGLRTSRYRAVGAVYRTIVYF